MALSRNFLERLHKASFVTVLTGAGMSAPSGIPTFRGKDGLWNKYNAHELANVQAFQKNPKLIWEWYRWRREIIRKASPNPGHFALVDLAKYFPDLQIITQNVDGLHQRAGTEKITELHGNIMRSKCIDCTYEAAAREAEYSTEIPRCPDCGAMLRPAVVWFGESLPAAAIDNAQQFSAAAEIIFSIGTSSLVEPAASLPYLAKGNGAFVVEVNPAETPLSEIADERFTAGADKFLPALVMVMQKLRKRA